MVKKYIVLLVASFSILTSVAQTFGPQQVISIEATLPRKVAVADIDGNGTLDVASAARTNNELAWFSNQTGEGDFGDLQLISESAENRSLALADMDNDGDIDVVSTTPFLNEVFWQENDGLGNFGPQLLIDTLPSAFDVVVADVNNDGFMDVISGSFNNYLLTLYINNGIGSFSERITLNSGTINGRSLDTGDIDGDGDIDIVASATGYIIVAWFENIDGLGSFSEMKPIYTLNYPFSTNAVHLADIDIDGTLDVIVSIRNDTIQMGWFKNLDGQGTFSDVIPIQNNNVNTTSISTADIDNDGIIDLLSTATVGRKIMWQKNLGDGAFAVEEIITNQAESSRHAIAVDIDNDGDLDVVGASQNDYKISWYENLTILSTPNNSIEGFVMSPNPTNTTVTFKAKSNDNFYVTMYTLQGKVVLKKGDVTTLDVSGLPNGLYFVEARQNKSITTAKLLIK